MIKAESHAQGVRITVDVPAGQEWTVTRTDGFPVRGGTGTGPAKFLDVAAPVNEPVTYLIDPPTWVEVARNLALDPAVSGSRPQDFGGWSGSSGNKVDEVFINSDWSLSGKAERRTFVEVGDPKSGDSAVYVGQAVSPNTVVTVSIRVMASRPGITIGQALAFSNTSSTQNIAGSGVFTFSEPGEVADIWVTFKAEEMQPDHRLIFNFNNKKQGDFLEISDADIYEGPYQPDRPWFSGDHAPDGMRTEWLGEPNNSASVLYGQQTQTTVTRRAEGHLLSSLNGLTQAGFRWLGDGDMPVEPRGYRADVPGRTRPVLRLQPVAADGGIAVTARVAGEANQVMRSLLLANRPMLLFHDRSKCEIPECDIPAVSCVFPASPASNPRTGHVRVATRDWVLEFLTIDVPGLASRVGIGVWEQLEAEQIVWADVEALAMPWTDFEDGGWINE